jgi:hypothetical protein
MVKVVDLKPFAFLTKGTSCAREFGCFSNEEAIKLANGTSMVLFGCPFVPEITEVHQRYSSTVKLESCYMTLTVL